MAASKLKTTDKIKASLIELYQTMPLEDITATALCEHAKINRATFYYHYNSVQDVLGEIEKQMEYEFSVFMGQSTMSSDGMPEKNFYVTFFEFVARNVGICKMLINAPRRSEFVTRALEAGRMKVIAEFSRLMPDCPLSKVNYYYTFVSNGFLGLLGYWLSTDMRESVVEIAEISKSISAGGMQYLYK